MPLLRVRHLWARYGRINAVQGVSFCVERGEVVGLAGANGAGKTTVLRVLATLMKPVAGRVLLDGVSIVHHPLSARRRTGFLPDGMGQYHDLDVTRYLHFFAAAYGLDRRRRFRVVDDVLELTEMTALAAAPVESLSRGLKQRLGLARVLLHDPDLLLLDEPTGGLDPRARIEMEALLLELQRLGKTIVLSSHNLHELERLCTRLAVLDQGRLVALSTVEAIAGRRGAASRILVQTTQPVPSRILDSLARVPGVTEIQVNGTRLSLSLDGRRTAPEDLLDFLREAGVRVRDFHSRALEVEELFLQVTQGSGH